MNVESAVQKNSLNEDSEFCNRDFYEGIVDQDEARIDYQLIQIERKSQE